MCGLRRVLLIGNVQVDENTAPQAFVLSYNIPDRKYDKFKLLKEVQDSRMITSLNFGPYDNGHLLVGLETGYLLAYEVVNNLDLVFEM